MLATPLGSTEHDQWPFRKDDLCAEKSFGARMPDRFAGSSSMPADYPQNSAYPHPGGTVANLPSPFSPVPDDPILRRSPSSLDFQVKEEVLAPGSGQLHDKGVPLRSPPSVAGQVRDGPDSWTGQTGLGIVQGESIPSIKDEEEDTMEDMDDYDDEHGKTPQTAAERTAARKKLKRFRLTHQQTRFLMSEFVKQPHPDAVQRGRLSKEIPGLSPRQVQVWFQNRRAKIKRLNAEDRDRLIQMRAVPDDFDNVQALHSPYGATPTHSGMGDHHPFGENANRSLADLRRSLNEEGPSPTGLNPGFDGAGFNQSPVSSTAVPGSSTSSDRFNPYGGHTSPIVGGPGGYSPGRGGFPNAIHMDQQGLHARLGSRPGEHVQRSRTVSAHPSARSWKGETIEYPGYQPPHGHMPGHAAVGHQHHPQSSYRPESLDMAGYNAGSYPEHTMHASSMVGDRPTPQQPSLERGRPRGLSATFPLTLDTRHQYQSPLQTPITPGHPDPNMAATTMGQYASRPAIYTTSYPTAPLTAPNPMQHMHREDESRYQENYMNAPATASGEFPRAGPIYENQVVDATTRTPMRDAFGGGRPDVFNQGQGRSVSYGEGMDGPSLLQRRVSLTISGAATGGRNAPKQQPYDANH